MKAHIVTKKTERVLSFGLEEAAQSSLSMILQDLFIEDYKVSPDELGQDVGYLAGFPGFVEKTETPDTSFPCEGVICMCGVSPARMDVLLKVLQEEHVVIPLKAMMTAINQSWSFEKLITELDKEHKMIAQRSKNKRETAHC